MGEPSSSSTALPVCCAVHFPGRIESIEEAVASIGGLTHVRKMLQNPRGCLKLRLTRQYQFQTPIPLKCRRTLDILVRGIKGTDGSWTCSVVALVEVAFIAETGRFYFCSRCDLKYGAVAIIQSPEHELSGSQMQDSRYMPPPCFTLINTPQNYDYEENAFLHRNTKTMAVLDAVGTSEANFLRSWIGISIMKFKGGEVPCAPPEGALDQVQLVEQRVLQKLRELF